MVCDETGRLIDGRKDYIIFFCVNSKEFFIYGVSSFRRLSSIGLPSAHSCASCKIWSARVASEDLECTEECDKNGKKTRFFIEFVVINDFLLLC